MSYGHALYYPHIHLSNKNWLKHALLYWEKLSRIVPKGLIPSDSEEVIRIRGESGFIEDYVPEEYDVQHAFYEFSEEYLHELLNYRHDREPDYFEDKFFGRRMPMDRIRIDLDAIRASGSYLHVQKMDRRLKALLLANGLAIPGKNQWEDWIKVDNHFGFAYMTYLAKSISAHHQFASITDLPEAYVRNSRVNAGRGSTSEFESSLAHLLVRYYAPADINSLSLDMILAFRQKHDNERRRFMLKIGSVANAVGQTCSEIAFNDALHLHEHELKEETEDLRKALKSCRIETIDKIMTIGIPTAVAFGAKGLPDSMQMPVTTAGIILGAWTLYHGRRQVQNELKKQNLYYLLSMQHNLAPEEFIDDFRNRIHSN